MPAYGTTTPNITFSTSGTYDGDLPVGNFTSAANAGTTSSGGVGGVIPSSLAAGDAMTAASWASEPFASDTGVMYFHSATRMADITDGASNTYLMGEKYLNPDHYTDANSAGDDQVRDTGAECDTMRVDRADTLHDRYGRPQLLLADAGHAWRRILFAIRHAHASGFNMAFCDGSVTSIGMDTIDLQTHGRLGNRSDGIPIDPKQL